MNKEAFLTYINTGSKNRMMKYTSIPYLNNNNNMMCVYTISINGQTLHNKPYTLEIKAFCDPLLLYYYRHV